MLRVRYLAPWIALLALLPAAAWAQQSTSADDDNLIAYFNRDVRVAADETVSSIVVVNGDAQIDGAVQQTLWVINGTATVAGQVTGDVMVINGDLNLGPTARVQNISLFNSTLARDPAATVTGDINEQGQFNLGWAGWWWFWLAATIVMLVAGLLFAAVGGRQLSEAGALITRQPAFTILATVIVVIGLPILAFAIFATIVGIPLGLGLLLFVLPALWFLGFIVSGNAIGAALVRLLGRGPRWEHPYLAVALGIIVLQVLGFIPGLGGLIALLAGTIGAGALVYRLFRAWRGTGTPTAPAMREPAAVR